MRAEPREQIPGQVVPVVAPDRTNPTHSAFNGIDLGPCMKALRRRATRLTGQSADADDLVQETLKRALIYMNDRADIANVQAYLCTMLNHAYYDWLKQHPAGDAVPLEDARLVSLPTQVDRLECREVMGTLNGLPNEQRQILILIGLEGHSYKDTAATLEIPIGTVMSRLSRARERLSHLTGRRTTAGSNSTDFN